MTKKIPNLILVISTLLIIVFRLFVDPFVYHSGYLDFSVSIEFIKILFGMGLILVLFREKKLSIMVSIVFASIMIGANISHIEIPIILLLLVLSVLDKRIEYVWFLICFVIIITIKLLVYNDIMLDSALSKVVIDFAHVALILGLFPIDIRTKKDADTIEQQYNFISVKRFKQGVILIGGLFFIVSVILFMFVKDDHQIIAAFRQIESQYEEKLSHTYDSEIGSVSMYILESVYPEIVVINVPAELAEDDMDSRLKVAYEIRDAYNQFKEKWYDENIDDKGSFNLSKILAEDFRFMISFGKKGFIVFDEHDFGKDTFFYNNQLYDY